MTEKKMTLEDFQALANRSTGLVPMRVERSFAPYFQGTIHGFPPAAALSHYENGIAVHADAPPSARPGVRRVARPAPPAGVRSTAIPTGDDAPLVIPDDWETMHHLKRLNLAAKISGIATRDLGNDEHARKIISSEIARRNA